MIKCPVCSKDHSTSIVHYRPRKEHGKQMTFIYESLLTTIDKTIQKADDAGRKLIQIRISYSEWKELQYELPFFVLEPKLEMTHRGDLLAVYKGIGIVASGKP